MTSLLRFGPEGAPYLRFTSPPPKVKRTKRHACKESWKPFYYGGSKKYKACSVHTCSAGLPRS